MHHRWQTDVSQNTETTGGPIAYMARNGVAANLLMFFIVAAGLVSMTGLVQEAFPVLSFDHVEVLVSYPGATPDEVEESIVLKIEEQISSLDGIREVVSVAAEGHASVTAGLKSNANLARSLDEIESAVSRIRTFPARAERPEVREMTNRQSVIRLILHGEVSERTLKELAYRTEDEIESLSAVSFVETSGVRAYEISIEAPLRRLRALGLTLEDIARSVREASGDLPAGSIETLHAEVRVRTTGSPFDLPDFEETVVVSRPDATVVRLGDVADVRDGFEDVDLITRYQGKRAAFVEVYRTADEQVLEVAEAVEDYVGRQLLPSLPQGVSVEIWNNDADLYEDRLGLMLKNGYLGLALVLVALSLFLEIRLAFWVALGIGISFVGALTVMFAFDISINTFSMFAFVLAVGIVIDDAVVVAEQVHAERRRGASGVAAAILGTNRIKRPVIFAVLTTVAAFAPLLFVPGPLGKLIGQVPIILISILLFSLAESLLVLPNHLSHLPGPDSSTANPVERSFSWIQARVDDGLQWFLRGPLDRGLRFATLQPAIVTATGIGMIVLCGALLASGIIGVIFVESVESDLVVANLETPEGTPGRRTDELATHVERAGLRAIERLSAERPANAEPLLVGVHLTVGAKPRQLGGATIQEPSLGPQSNIASVEFKLLEGARRDVAAHTFIEAWREEIGALPEARSLTISADVLDLGRPVQVELAHADLGRLGAVGAVLVQRLRELDGVFDVRSDHAVGQQEIQLALRPEGRILGLTLDELSRQVRSAFFGEEALRLQRGREEVGVYVRLPAEERDAIGDIERYVVRTPAGLEAPLSQVASVEFASSPALIRRKAGQRVLTVTADVDPSIVTGGEVHRELADAILPGLLPLNPGLSYEFGGQQQQQLESFDALGRSFVLALVVIYALLAIPFGSYTKPLIVMAVIPFGIIGAVLGHWLMGISFSATSVWGVIGLSGILVNDSLVMIDFIGQLHKQGTPARAAIIEGAKARFRPIFLTSITTFLGFAPLIFEQSLQAKFLIPLAASVGFGILFATVILMLIVPALATFYYRIARADRSSDSAMASAPAAS